MKARQDQRLGLRIRKVRVSVSDQRDELNERHLKSDLQRHGSVLDWTNQRIVIFLVEQVRYQVVFISARRCQPIYSHTGQLNRDREDTCAISLSSTGLKKWYS